MFRVGQGNLMYDYAVCLFDFFFSILFLRLVGMENLMYMYVHTNSGPVRSV